MQLFGACGDDFDPRLVRPRTPHGAEVEGPVRLALGREVGEVPVRQAGELPVVLGAVHLTRHTELVGGDEERVHRVVDGVPPRVLGPQLVREVARQVPSAGGEERVAQAPEVVFLRVDAAEAGRDEEVEE